MSWSDDNTAKIVRILASLKEERNRREVPLSLTSIIKPTKHTFMHNKKKKTLDFSIKVFDMNYNCYINTTTQVL